MKECVRHAHRLKKIIIHLRFLHTAPVLDFNIHVGSDAVQKLNPTMEIQMRRERKEKTIVSGLCHRLGGLSAVVDAHFSERKERQKCLKKKLRARISERERRNFERKHHLPGEKKKKKPANRRQKNMPANELVDIHEVGSNNARRALLRPCTDLIVLALRYLLSLHWEPPPVPIAMPLWSSHHKTQDVKFGSAIE